MLYEVITDFFNISIDDLLKNNYRILTKASYSVITSYSIHYTKLYEEQNKKDAQYRYRQLARMAAADYSDEIEGDHV